MNIIAFLLVGLLAGWIASSIVEGHGLGVIGDMVVGIIGAFIGGFIFSFLNIVAYGFWGSFVMSIIGAMALLSVVKMFATKHKNQIR